jgi:hypothetical protein
MSVSAHGYYGALEHHCLQKEGHEGEDQCEQVCEGSQSKSWTVRKRRYYGDKDCLAEATIWTGGRVMAGSIGWAGWTVAHLEIKKKTY